jgi:hypothetical protein
MSASVGIVNPHSRRKLLIACALVVAAGAVGFAPYRARAPRPDTFDATADLVRAAPEFVELWRGEPVVWPPLVLPYVERRELTVIDPTLLRVRRRSLDGKELRPQRRFHPATDHLLFAHVPFLATESGAYLGPLAADDSGRFVACGFDEQVFVFDLANGDLTIAKAATPGDDSGRPQRSRLRCPPRSALTARDGVSVVVHSHGGLRWEFLEVRAADDAPDGRRVRVHVKDGFLSKAPRATVDIVDVETGGVVARRNGLAGRRVAHHASWLAVDADRLAVGTLCDGKVRVERLGQAEDAYEIGDGDVTAVAAGPTGFVTGHRDGAVRRWRVRSDEVLGTLSGGPIDRLEVFGERIYARVESPDGGARNAAVFVDGRRIDFEHYESMRPIGRNDRWLHFVGPPGGVAVSARGAFSFEGLPVLAVGDWVVAAHADRTTVVDLSGAEARVIAEVPGVTSPPTVVRGVEGGFLLDGAAVSNTLRPAPGLSLDVKPDSERWKDPSPSRVRPPARLPTGAAPSFAQAFEAGRLHECPRTGLLTRLDEPEGLDAWDPAAPPDKARRFRRWKGAVTDARLLVSPDGDRFVVPSWDIDALRFGDFARGLAADAEAPLVGPHRGDDFRKDKLHDGEIGGRPERGARFAFVANDVVAVCEHDAVRLRHVPTGRDLGRLADPAEALCVSADGATLLLVAGPRVTVLRRR